MRATELSRSRLQAAGAADEPDAPAGAGAGAAAAAAAAAVPRSLLAAAARCSQPPYKPANSLRAA